MFCMEHGKEAQNHSDVAGKEHGKDKKNQREEDYPFLLVYIEIRVHVVWS